MSDKTRIAVVLGTIGLSGAAGLGYFVKVYLATQKSTASRAEVTAWEERLTAARTCLLGPDPASGKSSEAIAVRELSARRPAAWSRSRTSAGRSSPRPFVAEAPVVKVVTVATQGHVLGVWRKGAPPTYVSTTSELRPRFATTDGKVIDVIATTDDGVVIARIPAR